MGQLNEYNSWSLASNCLLRLNGTFTYMNTLCWLSLPGLQCSVWQLNFPILHGVLRVRRALFSTIIAPYEQVEHAFKPPNP
jgi:hypothetical protein